MLVTIEPKAPRPQWLRAPAPVGENYRNLKNLVEELKLHTVCESAACPNIGDCWNRRTATFMILGNVCTRRCGFCAVQKGAPLAVDYEAVSIRDHLTIAVARDIPHHNAVAPLDELTAKFRVPQRCASHMR